MTFAVKDKRGRPMKYPVRIESIRLSVELGALIGRIARMRRQDERDVVRVLLENMAREETEPPSEDEIRQYWLERCIKRRQ